MFELTSYWLFLHTIICYCIMKKALYNLFVNFTILGIINNYSRIFIKE